MTTGRGLRRSKPLRLIVLGFAWLGLTFTTCYSFHGDPVPGVADFDPERNGYLVLYSLVTIRGVSSRTATMVLFGLMAAGAALVVVGVVLAVRSRRPVERR